MENLVLFLFFSILTYYLSGYILLCNEPSIAIGNETSESGSNFIVLYMQHLNNYAQKHWIGAVAGYYIGLFLTFYYGVQFFHSSLPNLNNIGFTVSEYFFAGLYILALGSLSSKPLYLWAFKTEKVYILYPAVLLVILVYPISELLNFVHQMMSKYLFRLEENNLKLEIMDNQNLNWILKESVNPDNKGSGNNQEIIMLQNALVFSKVRVRECMIPRTEIEAVDINAPLHEVEKKFISTGYSKLAVYEDNLDNILGYISSKDMFKNPVSISTMLVNIAFVPETMPANRILHEFMHDHRTIAVVVDEYGGTTGIVTLEDIMEEIFGDIEDEHDTDDLIDKLINPNEYVFSGRLEIEYLNSKYNLNLPESEEYDTLAGYILYISHNLPKPKQVLETDDLSLTVLKVSSTRIELVLLKVKEN